MAVGGIILLSRVSNPESGGGVTMTNDEMNSAVARKLGYTPNKFGGWSGPCPTGGDWARSKLPNYCGSIQAAWEIVEFWLQSKMRVKRFELRKSNASSWYAVFEDGQSDQIYDAIAATAPEAICRAFLKLS
jgi:hypothetical protein